MRRKIRKEEIVGRNGIKCNILAGDDKPSKRRETLKSSNQTAYDARGGQGAAWSSTGGALIR